MSEFSLEAGGPGAGGKAVVEVVFVTSAVHTRLMNSCMILSCGAVKGPPWLKWPILQAHE
jgi:hypothetical protein